MIERGILFSAPMVRALLDGSKTQTRRVMKRQPYLSRTNPPNFSDTKPGDLFVCPDMFPTTDQRGSVFAECERIGVYHCMGQQAFAEKHSPYGQPGDRLWVRETWAPHPDFPLSAQRAVYRADPECEHDVERWRPSIHMPRPYSRILLEIVSVRVERLQDCSESDAVAEGIPRDTGVGTQFCRADPRNGYRHLWESINGAGSWDANPWVWVVEFKRVQS